jgi:hypothetical protein
VGLRRATAGGLATTLLLASLAAAEVVTLRSGDRITGRILSETPRTVRLQTPYGRLAIPRKQIATIVRADGTEERLNDPSGPPSNVPAAGTERLAKVVLIVTGKTFWQAWDPKEAGDPTLRLDVRLDEEPLVGYVDPKTDPGEIKGAVVNTFAYDAESVKIEVRPRASAAPPEVRPGRVVLRIDVAGGAGDNRRLRVAYQKNEGTPEEPAWRDLTAAEAAVTLKTDVPAFLQVRQDRGEMEFSGFPRRRMKNVETFHLEIVPE